MADLSFDFRLFRYALASAEHGSFRRAAAALNVQQSSVSRGVRNLEHRIGSKLFERGHAGIRPTPAGDRFLEEATLGFDHLRRATQRIGAVQRGEHGELTVGVSLPFSLLRELFERFRREHRGVSVEIIESTSSASMAMVRKRKVDVAFVSNLGTQEGTQSFRLRDEPMIAVLPKEHELAGANKVAWDDLSKERFILSAWGMGPDIEQELFLRIAKRGLTPRIQLHRVGQCNLINMVALGFGVTIVVGASPAPTIDGVALVPLVSRNVLSVHATWMESNSNPALTALTAIMRKLEGVPDSALG